MILCYTVPRIAVRRASSILSSVNVNVFGAAICSNLQQGRTPLMCATASRIHDSSGALDVLLKKCDEDAMETDWVMR